MTIETTALDPAERLKSKAAITAYLEAVFEEATVRTSRRRSAMPPESADIEAAGIERKVSASTSPRLIASGFCAA